MAETKRYFWLRLYDDFFKSKRIKKLRKMAGGDTYTIIYLKMQLLAMKSDGVLTWTGLESNFADELSLDIDESPEDIKVTLAYLLSCGLAETSDEVNFFLPYSVSNIGSETSSAQRVREHRERLKTLHCNNDVTQMKQVGNVEIEKEIDIEIEKEIDNNVTDVTVETPKTEINNKKVNYTKIKNLFNSICTSLPNIKIMTDARKQTIRAINKSVEEYGGYEKLFREVENSDFLSGKNGKWTGCSFDWIIKRANLTKICEGNYHNRVIKSTDATASYDLDLFEKSLNSKD